MSEPRHTGEKQVNIWTLFVVATIAVIFLFLGYLIGRVHERRIAKS